MTTAVLLLAGLSALLMLGVAAWARARVWLRQRRPASQAVPGAGPSSAEPVTPAFAPAPVPAPGALAASDEPAHQLSGEGECDEGALAFPDAHELLPAELMERLHAFALGEAGTATTAPPRRDDPSGLILDAGEILARIDEHPRYIPRRPHLLPQLMRAVSDPAGSARSIAKIIGQDPVLAGNLLRITNSAMYRVQAQRVESIDRAVALVGTDGIRRIIATALVQPVMDTKGGVFAGFAAVTWEHTVLAAGASAEHARRVEHCDAFSAQLLGLLSGLASIVVVQVLRDVHARHPMVASDPIIAATLLDKWALPSAQRIAGNWGLSGEMDQALRDQQSDAGRESWSPLGRSLYFGRVAAAAALLSVKGKLEKSEGMATVLAMEPSARVVGDICRRLMPDGESAGLDLSA